MGSINSTSGRRMSASLDLGASQSEDLPGSRSQRRERRASRGAENGGGEEGEFENGRSGDEEASGSAVGTADGDEPSSDSTDLSSILAYLIRSGQVRILTSDQEEYSDDDECIQPSSSSTVPNACVDSSRIEKNDIYEEILRKSGRSSAFDKSHPTVTHMLYKRQTGMRNQGRFTISDKRVISTAFLPNYCDIVACYRQKAFCGTYSVDGNIFLSASQDQYIRIYNTRDDEFKLLKAIRAKDVGWSVLDTAFSPDGNYMAYSSWSDCIHLCNVHGEDEIHQSLNLFPEENSFCIFSLTFSSDNREILGGANIGNLYVFDRDANQRTLKIDAHEDDVNAVAFADKSSQILFSGGDDGLVKIWDRRTLKEDHPVPVGILAGHYDGVTYIDSKGDARYLLSNSKDQSMKLWDIRKLSTSGAIASTIKAVSKQRWDYRWQQVPKKMYSKPLLEGDTSVMTYRGHSVLHTLIRCHFSPDFTTGQRYVYTGCAFGNIIVYDTLTGKVVRKLEGHRSSVRDVSWHPYENNIVSTSWDGTIRKWEYKSMDQYFDCRGEESSTDSDEEMSYATVRRSHRIRQQERSQKKRLKMMACSELSRTSGGLFDL